MIRRRLYLLILVAAGLLLPRSAFSDDPKAVRLPVTVKAIEESLDNEWFGVYFQGKKIGYINSGRDKVTVDGQLRYRETLVMSTKLRSFGQKSESKIEQSNFFDAKPPFRLVSADYKHTDNNLVTRIKLAATAKEKQYQATIAVGDNQPTKQIAKLDFTLADSMSSELWIKQKPKKGDQITTQDLEIEDLKLELSTATMLDSKEVFVNGVKVVYHDVRSINLKTNITSESKYDDQGRLISGNVAGSFEMRRESEELAKNTEFSADLFILGLATIDKDIGETKNLTGLILEIEDKEGGLLPDGPRQTLVAKNKEVALLRIGKKYGNHLKAVDKDIQEGLEETTTYPISDPKVKALAKEAIGDAKTDADKVKNLSAFVKKYIKPSMAATLPKMQDLMQRKAGDCKSYALMFTCLARAASIPSHEVSGFVYMGESTKAFGGHAWNEVLLDGYWIPVDASMNQVDVDPTHICLGTERESSKNLMRTFGKLHFKLIETERSN